VRARQRHAIRAAARDDAGRVERPELGSGAYSYPPRAVRPLLLDDPCVCGHARYSGHGRDGRCLRCSCPAWALAADQLALDDGRVPS